MYPIDLGHFNPRTHMGCDKAYCLQDVVAERISIHAPTWGATLAAVIIVSSTLNFNPRTHMGCDCIILDNDPQLKGFQSTHPHGVRR